MSEIWIYDDIGPDYWGLVSAKRVVNELQAIGKGKPVTVRINSPGGDVVEGQAIYNALRRHSEEGGAVTIEVDSLAASMASYIAMAGDTIRIAENAMFMIHLPWTVALGNADQLRQTADVLDKFGESAANVYSKRSGQDVAKIVEMLKAETWITAQEAIDLGLADEIGTALNVAAHVQEGRFSKLPAALTVTTEPPKVAKERQAAAAARIEHVRNQIRIARARLGVK